MQHVDTGGSGHQFGGELGLVANTGRGELDGAGLGFGSGDQIGNAVVR